jgi:hypothetical protein
VASSVTLSALHGGLVVAGGCVPEVVGRLAVRFDEPSSRSVHQPITAATPITITNITPPAIANRARFPVIAA